VNGDQHGPPLLVGFALGALLLLLDHRHAPRTETRAMRRS
jgi:hypothetical protein